MVKKQIITAATFGGKKNFFFALKKNPHLSLQQYHY